MKEVYKKLTRKIFGYSIAKIKFTIHENGDYELKVCSLIIDEKSFSDENTGSYGNVDGSISYAKPYIPIINENCINISIGLIEVKEAYREKGIATLMFRTLIEELADTYCEMRNIKNNDNVIISGWLSPAHKERYWDKSFPFYLSVAENILKLNPKYAYSRTLLRHSKISECFLYDSQNEMLCYLQNELGIERYIRQIQEILQFNGGLIIIYFSNYNIRI